VVASKTTRRYSPVRELEINLVLTFRVPEDGLTVDGILQGLEEQAPVIFNTLLKSMFKALEERIITSFVANIQDATYSTGINPTRGN
jgi:hypothetical protein